MCNFLVRDVSTNLWQVGVTDIGVLITTPAGFQSFAVKPPILTDGINNWQVTINTAGILSSTRISTPQIFVQTGIPMTSSGGVNWLFTINGVGVFQIKPFVGAFQDIIPYPQDIAMSRWPVNKGIFCTTCNNASVTVSGDLSCWCCTCNAFVRPEDTNIVVVLDE